MADIEEIVSLFTKLESRDSARNASYDDVVKFYAGDTYPDAKKKGYLEGITNQIGSIFEPPSNDEDSELRTPINIVKPAIENKVAFLALPPSIRVIEPPDIYAPGQGQLGGAPPAGPGIDQTTGGPLPHGMDQMGQMTLPSPDAGPMPGATPGMPTSQSTSGWSSDLADKLESVITSLLAFSNMPRRCRDAAWSLAAMDGAVIGVWPDMKHELPRIFTRTPQDFYPVAYDPDGLELTKALWKEEMSGEDVFARWGVDDYIDDDSVEVIQCIDEENYYTVLNKEMWAHKPVENKMGVVPIVCVGALGLPGMVFGSTNIKDAIPVAKLINRHMALTEEMANATVRPTIAVRDPINVPENIAIGEGGVITMGAQGGVELLGPISLPNAWWSLGQVLQEWFDLIADNPAVLRSEGGSLVTGKGFNAQLGPIAARMQTNLEILMSAWRKVIKYMLLMWANFPGTTGKVKASGIKNKMSFFFEAKPEEFLVNGEMWTEVDVFLEAQSYIDRQGNSVEIMQLVQNELISIDTAMDYLSQVKNKKTERIKIDRDRQWKAQGLAIQNQMANAPITANANISDQQMTNYGLERGFVGEAGPPGQKEGDTKFGVPQGMPPEMSGGMPPMSDGTEMSAEPEDDILSVIIDFFKSIPKLKGSVWIGGQVVNNPKAAASDPNWSVSVWVSDPQDKGTITRAAEKVPEIYGHIQFLTGQPGEGAKVIQVAGGTPMQLPNAAPPGEPAPGGLGLGGVPDMTGGLPPDLSMMGGM